ncbi:MAG: hypothetical protein ACFFCW_22200 [Candidatus Hodarchaeota archaeon]
MSVTTPRLSLQISFTLFDDNSPKTRLEINSWYCTSLAFELVRKRSRRETGDYPKLIRTLTTARMCLAGY